MIIFGSRGTTRFVASLFFVCSICGTPAAHQLYRVRRWFTLFFLPIFPLGHGKYVEQCAMCGGSVQLAREQAEQFKLEYTTQQILQQEEQRTPGLIENNSTQYK